MKRYFLILMMVAPIIVSAKLVLRVTIPDSVKVSGGGTFCNSATITASGGAGGVIYFQGTQSQGTSLDLPSTSQNVLVSGQYYFRSYNPTSGWGVEGSVIVNVDKPTGPIMISGRDTVCGRVSNLSASGGAGGIIYWQGTNSTGTSKTTPSTSHVVTASGTYYFRAYNAGCGWGIPFGKVFTMYPFNLTIVHYIPGLQKAGLTIKTTQRMFNRSHSILEAGNSIELKPGFLASNGTDFLAEIKPCD
jgi:hypothetical protein